MHTSYGSILFIAASCVLIQTCAQSVTDNVIDGKLFIQLNSIINQLETISCVFIEKESTTHISIVISTYEECKQFVTFRF